MKTENIFSIDLRTSGTAQFPIFFSTGFSMWALMTESMCCRKDIEILKYCCITLNLQHFSFSVSTVKMCNLAVI